IDQFVGFAAGDAVGLVIATRDGGHQAALRQLQLVLLERGMQQKLHRLAKYRVEVLLEAGPFEGAGRAAAPGLDTRGLSGEFYIKRISTLQRAAAGAPGLAVETAQS